MGKVKIITDTFSQEQKPGAEDVKAADLPFPALASAAMNGDKGAKAEMLRRIKS